MYLCCLPRRLEVLKVFCEFSSIDVYLALEFIYNLIMVALKYRILLSILWG